MELTVGELLDFIEKHKIPRDSKVLYQRIEDVYFEKHNWKTYNVPGESYNNAVSTNQILDDPELAKKMFPHVEEPELLRASETYLELLKEQYIIAFSPVYYKDEKHLFINAHY